MIDSVRVDKIKVRHKKTGEESFLTRKAYEYVKNEYVIVQDQPVKQEIPNVQLPVAPLASAAADVVSEIKVEKKRGRKPSEPKPVENEA